MLSTVEAAMRRRTKESWRHGTDQMHEITSDPRYPVVNGAGKVRLAPGGPDHVMQQIPLGGDSSECYVGLHSERISRRNHHAHLNHAAPLASWRIPLRTPVTTLILACRRNVHVLFLQRPCKCARTNYMRPQTDSNGLWI